MNYKRPICAAFLFAVLLMGGCQQQTTDTKTGEDTTSDIAKSSQISLDDDDYYQECEDATVISLDEESSDVTIQKGGNYRLSGTLQGSVIIDAGDETVRIILDNAHIQSSETAAIYVKQAKKVIVSLPEDTKNTISDTKTYQVDADEEPSAALFSKDDLIINGEGSLEVNALYKNGIQCKDTMKLVATNLTVNAANDGIKAKDALMIYQGSYTVEAQGDGIVTTNEKENGNLWIDGGSFNIQAQQDGIQSVGDVTIYDGTFSIMSGNGSEHTVEQGSTMQPWGEFDDHDETTSTSQKGIKASQTLTIYKGTYTINAKDDALHANQNIVIQDGTYTLRSDDDGIHADDTLTIQNGDITIPQSYEGIEGNQIVIKGGNMHICASDDGINAAGELQEPLLTIDGGVIFVDAYGDGVDSNRNIVMNNGTLIVMGPENGGNSALDFDGSFAMNGGTLIAVGSVEMAMTPSTDSKQPSMLIHADSVQSSETILYIQDEEGKVLLGVSPTKNWQSVIISSPQLQTGSTYEVYLGGSASAIENGWFTQATGGTRLTSMTLHETITSYGNAGIQAGGPQGPTGEEGMMEDAPMGDRHP